jgi:hypothetical protein
MFISLTNFVFISNFSLFAFRRSWLTPLVGLGY